MAKYSNSIMVSVMLFFLLACNTSKHSEVNNISNKTSKEYTVSGQTTQTTSYWGGACPNKEILDAMRTPRAYPGKKFHVRKGNINTLATPIIISFTTDDSGNFSFKLPPGTYSIIQDEQAKSIKSKDYKSQNISVDEKCLKEWWAKPYYLLKVKDAAIAGLKFEFNRSGIMPNDVPCQEYTGPQPP